MPIILLYLTMALNYANSSCYTKLLGSGIDSNAIKVFADLGDAISDTQTTQILIQRAANKVGCLKGEVKLISTSIACSEIIKNELYTKVCYAEAKNLGYFFVTKDFVDSAIVIFNRWD